MTIFAPDLKIMKARIVTEKNNLHPRNLHRFGYDFDELVISFPELKPFVFTNEFETKTIDFSNALAVRALNKSLLIANYGISNWDIPTDYLCPPIPGRVDYIHYLADLLADSNNGIIPNGEIVQGLDIGIGANCIYPILGNQVYGWSFVGTDIFEEAIENCEKIIQNNPQLIDFISLQLQGDGRFIFKNVILPEDKFAFTICNPPFHSSQEEATKSNIRKINALENTKNKKPILNFGGQNAELWCEGGELAFITQMIFESAKYPLQVFWFTTLVSKKENLASLYKTLNKVSAVEVKTIEMAQGQKTSRFLAWTFLSEKQQKSWKF
jgi:23S rRNA (adenine1618-N6)-methyltransferase